MRWGTGNRKLKCMYHCAYLYNYKQSLYCLGSHPSLFGLIDWSNPTRPQNKPKSFKYFLNPCHVIISSTLVQVLLLYKKNQVTILSAHYDRDQINWLSDIETCFHPLHIEVSHNFNEFAPSSMFGNIRKYEPSSLRNLAHFFRAWINSILETNLDSKFIHLISIDHGGPGKYNDEKWKWNELVVFYI